MIRLLADYLDSPKGDGFFVAIFVVASVFVVVSDRRWAR